jgi:hypothetical protein
MILTDTASPSMLPELCSSSIINIACKILQ